MLTATDFFCGMGGSSTGLVEAGFDVKVAANHWGVAIDTHSANHPDTEHLCADISNIDLRFLPRTRALWASPICTEVSPAGGRRKKSDARDLFEDHGHVPTAAFERTRVTFWEVIRATEIHRYEMVMIENVVEAAQWELFDVWLAGMRQLGYNAQFVSVSAAHVGGTDNDHAPQWRDRMYIVFNRHDVPAPDVDPRPLAWCDHCNHDVPARQQWKQPNGPKGRRIGKYGPQYHYVCPEGHGRIEPYVAPAAAAIDWTDLGTRIGDRTRPLAPRTLAKVKAGLSMVESGGFAFSMAHGGRAPALDVTSDPMRTWTTGDTEGLALSASFVATLRNNGNARSVGDPLATFTGGGYHHGLVIPFRRGSRPYPASAGPLSTMATRDQHGVLMPAHELDDAHFRMLRPREAANAQRFPRDYIIHGNQGEQQMQAGNAVAVNVAHWIGKRVADALDGGAAA